MPKVTKMGCRLFLNNYGNPLNNKYRNIDSGVHYTSIQNIDKHIIFQIIPLCSSYVLYY